MKKLFAILAIAGALTACNNSADSAESSDTTGSIDTTSTVAPMDTTNNNPYDGVIDTTVAAGAGADTTTQK